MLLLLPQALITFPVGIQCCSERGAFHFPLDGPGKSLQDSNEIQKFFNTIFEEVNPAILH